MFISCVFSEVTWCCNVSDIYGIFVNDVTNCVFVFMIYVCKNVVKVIWQAFLAVFYVLLCMGVSSYVV